MDGVFRMGELKIESAKGRYAVFDDENQLVAQDDDLDAALSIAEDLGARCPAIINLDIMLEQAHIF